MTPLSQPVLLARSRVRLAILPGSDRLSWVVLTPPSGPCQEVGEGWRTLALTLGQLPKEQALLTHTLPYFLLHTPDP